MLIVLFGIPGAGKSFIGRLLAEQYGYHFYEADADLTPAMVQAVQAQMIFTDQMRDEFFAIVSDRITALQQRHKKIVMAQALAKEKNRLQLLKQFPDTQFIWVDASSEVIERRLCIRADWVSFDYAEKIRKIFDTPQIPHILLDNNQDVTHLKQQLVFHMKNMDDSAETERIFSELKQIYALAEATGA